MMDIEFVETDPPREVRVSAPDVRALRRARHGLLVEELPDSRARVGPRLGYAGTVLLPSGLRIVVRPKAAIHNLSELLALGFGHGGSLSG